MSSCFTDDPCSCNITVYFNTGFEYPDGDGYIGRYGGKEDAMFDMGSWDWRNREIVKRILNEKHPNWPSIDVSNNVEGTRQLYIVLKEQEPSVPMKIRFGILVWHQLGYKRDLQAVYQTGQCGSRQCWHRTNGSNVVEW